MDRLKKQSKSIKKGLQILSHIIIVIILLLITSGFIIQLSRTQTYIAQKAADYLSEQLKVPIKIEGVDIEFFSKVVLEGVYIEDLHKDTLLFAKKLKVNIGDINKKSRTLIINSIALVNASSKIIRYKSDGEYNYQFIIDAFASSDTTSTNNAEQWDIQFKNVILENIRFSYKDEKHYYPISFGMNYTDIHTNDIFANITDIHFNKDTIFGNIIQLSAREKCGFELKHFSGNSQVSSTGIRVDSLQIKTPTSNIATDLKFSYKQYKDFLDFNEKVLFSGRFNKSFVDMQDIAYFAPELEGLNKTIVLTGIVNGRVNDLKGNKMDISIANSQTQFKGNLRLTGLPDVEQTFIYLNVDQLKTQYNDLAQIPVYPFESGNMLALPENLKYLESAIFKGTFTGLYNDFYAFGNLTSSLGNLSMDLSMTYDKKNKREKYRGKIKSTDFDFGKFFESSLIGKATANVEVDGVGLSLEKLNARLDGTIASLDFKNYNYKNVQIKGDVAKKIFRGDLNVKDENIDFAFNGNIDYSGSNPDFDFVASLNKAHLFELHFIDTNKRTNLSARLNVQMQGNTIDDLIGKLEINNIKYTQDNSLYTSEGIKLISEINNNNKTLSFKSDFMDAKLVGAFNISELPLALEKEASKYLPTYFNDFLAYKKAAVQTFDYEIEFKNTKSLTALFVPQLKLAPNSILQGKFNSELNYFSAEGKFVQLSWNNMVFKNAEVSISGNEKLLINSNVERLNFADSIWIDALKIKGNAYEDSLNTHITWKNNSVKENSGDIKTLLSVHKDKKIYINIYPSQFVVYDSAWSISLKENIILDTSYISIKELAVTHNLQHLLLDGIISKNKTDRFNINLKNFNLENFNFYTSAVGFNFRGYVNSQSTLSGMFESPIFISETNFNTLEINGNKLGEGQIQSLWVNDKDVLVLKGGFAFNDIPNISFKGYYSPKKQNNSLNIDLSLENINMNMFKPLVKDVCSEFKGVISGKAHVGGSPARPIFSGFINVDAENVTIDYLKTAYRFSHKIDIDSNSFNISDLTLYDVNYNTAKVKGKLLHNNFSDFKLDFIINADKFMGLNTTARDNNLFYGKAYFNGIVNISGTIDDILIDANVKTTSVSIGDKSDKLNVLSKTEITKLYIPLNSQSDLGENDFITFVKKDMKEYTAEKNKNIQGITMNFQLQAAPDAEVQLIFDQKVGDIIKARGSGNIKMDIDTKGEFKMYGSYVIEDGDYLFTLKNVINKKFDIEKGGTIKWTGIPYKADLNVTAKYKTKALLSPIIGAVNTTNIDAGKHYPVELKLNMSGDLQKPAINFGLDFPTLNTSNKQTIMGYLNNETEINRQVVPLILASTFISPTQGNANSTFSGSGSLSANTVELLSNQLNNMLKGISKDYVNVGVNYSPGTAASREELDLALSTQLFDNKVTIDGNLGVNNNKTTNVKNNTNNIVGDVNIDYKLTDDGKARVKAFNRTNDNIQLSTNGLYTQGVGVFYREEFDTLTELYRRYKAIFNRKKKTNLPPPPSDSIESE